LSELKLVEKTARNGNHNLVKMKIWLMITVPTVLVSGTGTKSHARQNETENASGKWGQPFVMTNARKCAEKLPYGNSPIKFDKDQSAYLSTAARSVCHDEFLQYLYPNGLETTPVMVIFWKFDDVKTVEDRFYSAVQSGEKVTWTIHYHNEIITKSQVWRFSDSMGNVRKNLVATNKLNSQMMTVLGEVVPHKSMVILGVLLTTTGKPIGMALTARATISM